MKKILVVDDSHLTRFMVKKILESNGYTVTELASGEEVLTRIKQKDEPFDLLILDIYLPGISGFHTLSKIKEDPRYAYVPVMVFTFDTSPATVRQAIQLGAVDFIRKPFKPEDLLSRVKNIIGPAAKKDEKSVIQDVHKVMSLEINRAVRGKTPLSIIIGNRKNESQDRMEELVEAIRSILRAIDTTIAFNSNSFITILPITNASGAQVVTQKISNLLSTKDEGGTWHFASATFPENGHTTEELLAYASNRLTKKD